MVFYHFLEFHVILTRPVLSPQTEALPFSYRQLQRRRAPVLFSSAGPQLPGLVSAPLLGPDGRLSFGPVQPERLASPPPPPPQSPPQLVRLAPQLLVAAALRQLLAVAYRGGGVSGPEPLSSQFLRVPASAPLLPPSPGELLRTPGSGRTLPPEPGQRLLQRRQVLQQSQQIVSSENPRGRRQDRAESSCSTEETSHKTSHYCSIQANL